MENASKALLMVASVIVGVLILGIGVYLFKIFGNYSGNIAERIDQIQTDSFNTQFTKYQSSFIEGQGWNNLCRIYDVITLTNLANKNNTELGFYSDLYELGEAQNALRYITVTLKDGNKTIYYLERANTSTLNSILQQYSYEYDDDGNVVIPQFRCDVHINTESKLVDEVTFALVK